mgnify:CR=1 FL=1
MYSNEIWFNSGNADIDFQIGAVGASKDAFVVQGSSGNVGIGTDSPYYKTHISFDNSTTSFSGGSSGNWGGNGLRIENTNSTADTKATIQLRAYDFDAFISGVKKSGANTGEIHFTVDNHPDLNQILTLTKNKISGSSTSTGSFGRLEVAASASFGAIITNHISASHYHGQIGARYVHSQGTPSTTWSIPHNLGTQYPNVTVYNSDSEMIIPTSVTAHGGTSMTLTFSEAVGGAAMLGLGGGSDNITGRTFNFDQETASTIWRVTHSLGEQYPAITIYDENDEVIVPGRIHATNVGETSVYFEHATSGHGHFSVGNGLPGINSDNAATIEPFNGNNL